MSAPTVYGDILERFKGLRGLVLGDVMLDEYIFGKASRISPEAPVMVVHRQSQRSVPGGAANVALNAAALGANISLLGVIGTDAAGQRLKAALHERGIDGGDLLEDDDRPTTTKTRVIANHSHQVLRIDDESSEPLSRGAETVMLARLEKALPGSQFVLFSDYAKGFLTPAIIEKTLELAKSLNVPVIANPKPGTASRYVGATLISLNRSEAAGLLGIPSLTAGDAAEAADQIRQALKAKAIVVTLGEDGLAASFEFGTAVQPAIRVEVYDEAGAGDTAIATLALCQGSGTLNRAGLGLAVRTAAAVVRKVGVAVPSPEDLEFIALSKVS